LACCGGAVVSFLVAAIFALYAIILVRELSVLFLLILGALLYAAQLSTNVFPGLGSRALVASGIILGSFILQIIGHNLHEDYQAPPSLNYGFVAAPVLKSVRLLFRLVNFKSQKSSIIMKQVEEIRLRASSRLLPQKVEIDGIGVVGGG
jgi:hypothetical protein